MDNKEKSKRLERKSTSKSSIKTMLLIVPIVVIIGAIALISWISRDVSRDSLYNQMDSDSTILMEQVIRNGHRDRNRVLFSLQYQCLHKLNICHNQYYNYYSNIEIKKDPSLYSG